MIEKAIAIKPNSQHLYNNLGLQYRHKHEYQKAMSAFKKSIDIKEECTTWAMLGGCYGELKEYEEAEKCLKRSLELDNNFGAAHCDLASIYHLKGDWKKGFAEYEHRFEVYDQLKIWNKIYCKSNKWKGESLAGKKIIVHTEQGHGDAIQFVRYLPNLRQSGAYVILHCAEVVADLFKNLADEKLQIKIRYIFI